MNEKDNIYFIYTTITIKTIYTHVLFIFIIGFINLY